MDFGDETDQVAVVCFGNFVGEYTSFSVPTVLSIYSFRLRDHVVDRTLRANTLRVTPCGAPAGLIPRDRCSSYSFCIPEIYPFTVLNCKPNPVSVVSSEASCSSSSAGYVLVPARSCCSSLTGKGFIRGPFGRDWGPGPKTTFLEFLVGINPNLL